MYHETLNKFQLYIIKCTHGIKYYCIYHVYDSNQQDPKSQRCDHPNVAKTILNQIIFYTPPIHKRKYVNKPRLKTRPRLK